MSAYVAAIGTFRNLVDEQASTQEIPEYTCTLIDQVLEHVGSALVNHALNVKWRNPSDADPENLKEAIARLDAVAQELTKVESLMETIRRDNEQLRALGKAWYQLSKDSLASLEVLSNEEQWKEVPQWIKDQLC